MPRSSLFTVASPSGLGGLDSRSNTLGELIVLEPVKKALLGDVMVHTIHHVYRSVWPAGEAKPHGGATLVLRMLVKLAYSFSGCTSVKRFLLTQVRHIIRLHSAHKYRRDVGLP